MALVVTHISAATASLTWALYERVKYGRSSMVGMVTGTIAGLASITPASGFVGPVGALIIGAVAGVLCQVAVNLAKEKFRLDDTLDVFAVHGVGGVFGTLMAPVLAVGALEGGQGVVTQLIALAAVGAFTVVVTAVLVKLSSLVFPMRVSEEAEYDGLVITAHGERAYDLAA
jgi:Amt family ammonium transporter